MQLRRGELEQDAAPLVGRGRLGERAGQACDRDRGRTAGARETRRAPEDRHHGRVGGGLRLEQVNGHLVLTRPLAGQEVRGAPVRPLPLAGLHVRVHGCAQDRVGERERSGRGEDRGLGERSRELLGLRHLDPGQRRRPVHRHRVPQHGHGARQLRRLAAQSREPEQHGARDGRWCELAHELDSLRARRQALRSQLPQ